MTAPDAPQRVELREEMAAIVEAALSRHGVNVGDCEGTLDDADAAITLISERCAQVADNHVALGYMSGRERYYCHQHGDEIAETIRQLAPQPEARS
jgi:hypothetical protein